MIQSMSLVSRCLAIAAVMLVPFIANVGLAQANEEECYGLTEHPEPGDYVLYATTDPGVPWQARAGNGVHSVSYRQLPPNSTITLGDGTVQVIGPDYTGYRVAYTATVSGATLLICSQQLSYWAHSRVGPPSDPAPPQQPPPPTNNAPTVNGTTSIRYAENGTSTVATYTATDPENDQITWSLSGTDSSDFSVLRGDLTFNAAPDYEQPADADTNNVYRVTVRAFDGTHTVTLDVTVTVTDVNEPPWFPGASVARSVVRSAAVGDYVGAPIVSTDPEGDPLIYSLGGTDAVSFAIDSSTGQLSTAVVLD